MKNILIIYCILLTFTSCNIEYNGETKLVVTGKLIDKNGVPIPENDVKIFIRSVAEMNQNWDMISYGKTDSNGNFRYIFPAPDLDNEIEISINDGMADYYSNYNVGEFQSKHIIALKKNFQNYKLNLDNVTLYRNNEITQLVIILNQSTNKKQLLSLNIEGNTVTYNSNLNPIVNPNYTPPLETYYYTLKNQTLILKYKVTDYTSGTPVTTENSKSIPISNEKVVYSLTY